MQGQGLAGDGGVGDRGGGGAGQALGWTMAASHCSYPLWHRCPCLSPCDLTLTYFPSSSSPTSRFRRWSSPFGDQPGMTMSDSEAQPRLPMMARGSDPHPSARPAGLRQRKRDRGQGQAWHAAEGLYTRASKMTTGEKAFRWASWPLRRRELFTEHIVQDGHGVSRLHERVM